MQPLGEFDLWLSFTHEDNVTPRHNCLALTTHFHSPRKAIERRSQIIELHLDPTSTQGLQRDREVESSKRFKTTKISGVMLADPPSRFAKPGRDD